MGAFRANRQEAVKTAAGIVMLPVDTATSVAGTGTDLDGDYADSNALARALSTQRHRARLHGPPDVPRVGRARATRRCGAPRTTS